MVIGIRAMNTKQFHFIPDTHKRAAKKDELRASVNVKYKHIRFPAAVVKTLDLQKMFIKFYFDEEKRAIGFRLQDVITLEEKKNGWRLCKPDKFGQITIQIGSCLEHFKFRDGDELFKKLKIERYRELGMLDPKTYYYVELKK